MNTLSFLSNEENLLINNLKIDKNSLNKNEKMDLDNKIIKYIDNYLIYISNKNCKDKLLILKKFFNKLIKIVKDLEDDIVFLINNEWIKKFKLFIKNKEENLEKIENINIQLKLNKKENINGMFSTVNKFLFYSIFVVYGCDVLLFSYIKNNNINKKFLYKLSCGLLKIDDFYIDDSINLKNLNENINKLIMKFLKKKSLHYSTKSIKILNNKYSDDFISNDLEKKSTNDTLNTNIFFKNKFIFIEETSKIKLTVNYWTEENQDADKSSNYLINYSNYDSKKRKKIWNFINRKETVIDIFDNKNNFINFDLKFNNNFSKTYFTDISYHILVSNLNLWEFLKLDNYKNNDFIQNLNKDLNNTEYYIFSNINCNFIDKFFVNKINKFLEVINFLNINYKEDNIVYKNISINHISKNEINLYLEKWNRIKIEYFSQVKEYYLCLFCMKETNEITEKNYHNLFINSNINISSLLDFFFNPNLIFNSICSFCNKNNMLKKITLSILPNFLIFKINYTNHNLKLDISNEYYNFFGIKYEIGIVIYKNNVIYLKDKSKNEWLKINKNKRFKKNLPKKHKICEFIIFLKC